MVAPERAAGRIYQLQGNSNEREQSGIFFSSFGTEGMKRMASSGSVQLVLRGVSLSPPSKSQSSVPLPSEMLSQAVDNRSGDSQICGVHPRAPG